MLALFVHWSVCHFHPLTRNVLGKVVDGIIYVWLGQNFWLIILHSCIGWSCHCLFLKLLKWFLRQKIIFPINNRYHPSKQSLISNFNIHVSHFLRPCWLVFFCAERSFGCEHRLDFLLHNFWIYLNIYWVLLLLHLLHLLDCHTLWHVVIFMHLRTSVLLRPLARILLWMTWVKVDWLVKHHAVLNILGVSFRLVINMRTSIHEYRFRWTCLSIVSICYQRDRSSSKSRGTSFDKRSRRILLNLRIIRPYILDPYRVTALLNW